MAHRRRFITWKQFFGIYRISLDFVTKRKWTFLQKNIFFTENEHFYRRENILFLHKFSLITRCNCNSFFAFFFYSYWNNALRNCNYHLQPVVYIWKVASRLTVLMRSHMGHQSMCPWESHTKTHLKIQKVSNKEKFNIFWVMKSLHQLITYKA